MATYTFTAWNLAAVDSRMSGRQGGNDFVGRLHRVRIHRSGVIRAALIRAALIRQQSSCLPGATRRACLCSERPPPRLPHARRGVPAGLVDELWREATSGAREALWRLARRTSPPQTPRMRFGAPGGPYSHVPSEKLPHRIAPARNIPVNSPLKLSHILGK